MDMLEAWMQFIINPSSDVVKELEMNVPEIKEAKEELLRLSSDEDAIQIYEQRKRSMLDKVSDIEKNDLFYVCSLIEFIGRKTKNKRSTISEILGKEELKRQLDIAEVNHCLSFEQVSDEIIEHFNIKQGDFDTVGLCKYNVPSVQSIGKVYQRLIISIISEEDNLVDVLFKVFTSFISDKISEFNSSVYYSNPEYLKYSYLEGKLLE